MLKLSSIFSHEARIESLVIQFEADYQTALKQGLDIYFGVGYATNEGEFKHEVRQFEKSYDNQQAEQISLMV